MRRDSYVAGIVTQIGKFSVWFVTMDWMEMREA
jgi:hypothetical protein